MGRPRARNARRKKVTIRLDPEETAFLDAEVARLGVDASHLLRTGLATLKLLENSLVVTGRDKALVELAAARSGLSPEQVLASAITTLLLLLADSNLSGANLTPTPSSRP